MVRRRSSPFVLAFLIAALVGAVVQIAPAMAKDKDKKEPPKGAAPADDKDKPYQDWGKVLKDATKTEGFFTLHRKRDNLYLEIKPDQLDKPVLGIFSLASGIGSNFVLGGLPLNDRLIEFHRVGERVFVQEMNTRFNSPAGSTWEKARDLSYGNSVLASLKIESVHDSTKAILVDFGQFLVSDVTDLAEGLGYSLASGPAPGPRSMRFDKDRSALTSVKAFPENLEFEALLTFSPNSRTQLLMDGVSDERYIPIKVHYSFSKLPDVPMQPRWADDRVGYFLTAKKDFANDESENFWARYVNRWRLEKKDPTATLSEPVKPITFYIDPTVPEKYRGWVKEGVEKWQKAFEAAGFKNGIVAKDAPADSNWDAEDVRYSTIRWITSTTPSFGAIGPSRTDPRTGEILDADILFEAAMLQNYRNAYRRYSGPDELGADALPATRMAFHAIPGLPMEEQCLAQQGVADGGALLRAGLLMDGALPPGSPVPDAYMHDAVVWVTMHEVGHTLGLRHNFRGSTATPYDKLNDKAWVDAHGLYTSVMEYPTPNISLDRTKQGYYYTTGAGSGDLWVIRYGYTPSGKTDPKADYQFARAIADESTAPGHEYSTDDDTYPLTSLDPRSNIFDLSDDPLRFAKDRTAYISTMWKAGKLEDRIVGDSGDLTALRRAMDTLLGQYGTALGVAVKYVGGQYSTRVHRGQPGEVAPLQPVTAAKQKEALDFLGTRAFAAGSFAMPTGLLNRLAPERWAHWGMPGYFGNPRLDYDLNNRVLAIQTTLLNGLFEPQLLARLREAESRSADAFRLADHFEKTTRLLWGEVAGSSPEQFKALEGPSTRRDVQRVYVNRLADLVVNPPAGAPDDARALARLQLTRIDGRCKQALAAAGESPMGDYTRAHLTETRARVKRALEAGREADAGGGGRSGGASASE